MYHHSVCTGHFCNHCYHVDNNATWTVVPVGHVMTRCCRCGSTKLEHQDNTHQYVHYIWPTVVYQPSHWQVCRPDCGHTAGWSFQRDGVRNGRWI